MKAIKKVKEYFLLSEIGRGAFGKVYEALSEKNNNLYAIKALSTETIKNPRLAEQLKKELKLLYSLNHDNIIKIVNVEKTKNNIYLVLEYCNGGTLLDYICYFKKTFHKNLPEEIIQNIMRQIIIGLKYMHEKNIIHRDIKLENILINFDDIPNEFIFDNYSNNSNENVKSGNNIYNNKLGENCNFNLNYIENLSQFINKRKDSYSIHKIYSEKNLLKDKFTIKIADLGYARILQASEGTSSICGTPLFMAPDIINIISNLHNEVPENTNINSKNIPNNPGENYNLPYSYNSSIDIWSLGTVFFELLLGKTPFPGSYDNEIFQKILNGIYHLPKNLKISAEALLLLLSLMNFYPEKRLSITELLQQSFLCRNFDNFHYINLELLDNEESTQPYIEVNSKYPTNFLSKIFHFFKLEMPQNNSFGAYETSIDYQLVVRNCLNQFLITESSKLEDGLIKETNYFANKVKF